MAGPSLGSGQTRANIFFVMDWTASAAIRALAGSYTPHGPSQWASAIRGVFMFHANGRTHKKVILSFDASPDNDGPRPTTKGC